MAKVKTSIGDIFSAKLNEREKKYFQYITNDMLQLNSDVIRAFKKIYAIDEQPELSDIVSDEIDFYAHCIVPLGIKMGIWEKVGNILELGNAEILFRSSNDYGSRPGEQVKISFDWSLWKIGDTKYTYVRNLEGKNRNADIGVVVRPIDIVNKLDTGEYNFVYPGFL